MKRFYIHKLGCPKNDVDAEYIAGFLRAKNLEPTEFPENADLLIVNSCGFIQPAKEESIDAVLDLASLKKKDKEKKLVITGCLSQRYSKELAREIPELDAILGINDFAELDKLLTGRSGRIVAARKNPRAYPAYEFPRAVVSSEPFAYLKISDGCDNRCAYCSIPDIRGPYRSRPVVDIVREAAYLLECGKRELILVSQESTAYGRDLAGHCQLIPLLDRLTALDGDFWIRIMYLHPARLEPKLIDYIIDNHKICNYFDLPLQHIDDDLLRAMGRKTSRARIESLLDLIRARDSRSAIRTNFIAGFPGETEEQFERLCQFIVERRFERLGAFVYSPEEGTPAASLPDQVDEDTREWRYHRLMELQQNIAFENNADEVGRRHEVIVDAVDRDKHCGIGRTRFDAPEVDQHVLLDFDDADPGDIVAVDIRGCDGYDVLGGRRTV